MRTKQFVHIIAYHFKSIKITIFVLNTATIMNIFHFKTVFAGANSFIFLFILTHSLILLPIYLFIKISMMAGKAYNKLTSTVQQW